MTTATRPPDMSDTTISVPEDLADELYERKARGESYADVIRRLIEKAETAETTDTTAAAGVATSEERPSDKPDVADAGQETPQEDAGERDLSALIDAVADDVLPGSGRKLEDRREALHAAVEYLREHGEATPADFRADVYPDYPAHYTDADDPARSWWKNCIYKGLAELADRTDKIERADTSGEWTYWGDVDE